MDPKEPPLEFMLEGAPIKTETLDEDFEPESRQDEDTLAEDPLQPTLRNQRLDSQAKLMLINVYKYFRKLRLIRAKETGEDMNVNVAVAEATGVSDSTLKRILSEYRTTGIEGAIRPPSKTRIRKRKSDIVVQVEEDSPTVTVKKQREKK